MAGFGSKPPPVSVREQGEFVKSPSLFISRISFVRDYIIRDGVAYLSRIDSSIRTRIVGDANLLVTYSNHKPATGDPEAAETGPAADSR